MSIKFKRFLSIILIMALCIACCNMPVYANEENYTSDEVSSSELYEEKNEEIVEKIEPQKITVSDTFMSYIDKSEFESHNYTVRLEEQEKLNTYVFQNADKTTSVYYFDENLKYIDDKGEIVEKDLSLVEAKDGYTTKKNDINIHLPSTLVTGVTVGYDDYSISISPISASKVTSLEKISAEKSKDSVVYNEVFGENTKFVYTPTLSGLNKGIILSEYTPNTEFSFTIKTNGLSVIEKDGGYYVAEAGKTDTIFKLGDVVAYDATGKPSMVKTIVKTVRNSSEYRVTFEVDEEFLQNSETVYPVTLNSNIEGSGNRSGADAIEDAPIYQGYPNNNFGTYLFNPVGTPSADFGVGRTVVRLTGLISSTEYLSINKDQIISVTFNIREGSGGSSQYVNIHPIIGGTGWTESGIKWNNTGIYMPTTTYGGTLLGGNKSTIDITNLVKEWKSGTYPANGGFIMISTNESNNRNFLSSEYSTASYRPYVVMEYGAVISIVPPSVTIVEGNTSALVAVTRPSGQTVTWSTSNSSIATVNSNGVVSANKAGSATITATMVGSDGVTYSAHCTVYVTIPDGVYYIKNKNSNYYLTTSESIPSAPGVVQSSKYESNVPDTIRICQMWKIKYLGNGMYSVRPLRQLNTGLHVTNNNVDVVNVGTIDTTVGILPSATWEITTAFGGYVFGNSEANTYMQIADSSTFLDAPVISHFFWLADNNCLWELENISSPPNGAYLYDISKEFIVSTTIVYIDIGETKSLSELGLIAVAYSGTNISQSFSWYSTSGNIATVDANGTVTGVFGGEATIAGCVYRGNTYHYISYTIRVGYPSLFNLLIDENIINKQQLYFTGDGFSLTTTSVSTILVNNGINYLPEDSNYAKQCNVSVFFDDWYIYAIKDGTTEAYGLYKMREQENDRDMNGDGIFDADEDDPGVTISFIGFDSTKLIDCLNNDTGTNRYALYQALTKPTGPGVYEHDVILADYFADTSSDGAYLIAEKSVSFFANSASGNVINAPSYLVWLLGEIENTRIRLQGMPSTSAEYATLLQYVEDLERIPNALETINNAVEIPIFDFDDCTITVQNKNSLTTLEMQAILSCFTANVTFNSFAAEVEFHADAVSSWHNNIPIIGDQIWYEASVRADMAIGEEHESGFYDEYYDLSSDLVQAQANEHGGY